jgi:TetR/AcrR family transcriptional regulator, tetracycline repressor protein
VPALDEDVIATAALAVLDERGTSGLTMRAVAEALGVTPMALYYHVSDKASLVALVIDAAIRERPLPAVNPVWQDDLFAMAHWFRQTARAHPAIAALRRTYGVWTPAALEMTERSLAAWQRSGLDTERAVVAATTSSMAIVGLVSEEQAFRRITPPRDALVTSLPNARLLFNSRHNSDDEFELAVRAIIDGLYARLTSMMIDGAPQKPKRRASAAGIDPNGTLGADSDPEREGGSTPVALPSSTA